MKNSDFPTRSSMPPIPAVSSGFGLSQNMAPAMSHTSLTMGTQLPTTALFTHAQIETLQGQIRQYKALCKQYDQLKQSPSLETKPQSAPPTASHHSIPLSVAASSSATSSLVAPTTDSAAPAAASLGKAEFKDTIPARIAAKSNLHTIPVVSGVFYTGLQKSDAGMFPSPPWLFGPIDTLGHEEKSSMPMVLQLLQAKEELVAKSLRLDNGERSSTLSNKLVVLQRKVRASVAGAVSVAPLENIHAVKLLNRNQFRRVRRQHRRDTKSSGREQRKRVTDREEARRRKHQSFLRALLRHKEDFFKFHRAKRTDCARTARTVKLLLESEQQAKEKEDDKTERRRLQALKENDMEAYAKLVQETKNERLQYLLRQTDEYIATINRMVHDQRVEARHEQEELHAQAAAMRGMGLEGGQAIVSRKYYQDTHQHVEEVRQPRMLVGGDLKEYQLAGLQWLVSLYNNNLNGILADEMGLGKTIQTIALLAYVMEFKHNNGPFLVVVPLSTLSNWVNEFNKWAPDMIRIVYKGNPATRKQVFKDEVEGGLFNVLLTTYEYVMKDKALLRKMMWQYIIVDEGHRMKNAQSKFAETLGTLYQSRHRILLTGTPLQNNLPELWSLLNFLLPKIFSSVETFDQWFNKPFATFRAGPIEQNESDILTTEERMLIIHRLHEVLRPFMLRRVKSMVMDQLPDKVEKVIRCELSGWQKLLYKRIQDTGAAKIGPDGVAGGSGLNNVIMQLRKVCNHPYLFLTEGWLIDDDIARCSGKFELLDRMLPKLKAAGHRVLLFSQMTQLMTVLEDFFKLRGFQYLRLDGGTSADEREQRMFMFNDPDSPYFIFLLSTRAGGLGLNLATADTVILFDSDWNPMMDAQAQDRAHRIGQKNEVRVFRLITTSPVEERILSRATDKLNLTGLVVEAGKFNKTSKVQERKEMMETLLKEWDEQDESDADDNDVLDEDQINELMAVNEEELRLYQQMDSARDRRRADTWKRYHSQRGVAAESIPSLPPLLMGEGEIPGWLSSSKSTPMQLDVTEPLDVHPGFTEPQSEADDSNSMYPSRKRKEINYSEDRQFARPFDVDSSDSQEARPVKHVRAVMGGGDDMYKDLAQIIKGIRNLKDEYNRPISKLFAEKPSRQALPDYYMVITKPIALKDISRKIREKKYAGLDDFKADMELLCRNARTYNQETSIVYQYSEQILAYYREQVQALEEGRSLK